MLFFLRFMNQNRNINYFHCTINYFYNATRRNVICQNQGLQLHLKPFNEKNGMVLNDKWRYFHIDLCLTLCHQVDNVRKLKYHTKELILSYYLPIISYI